MTPSGIEPATFQFVAQHLKHCATAAPFLCDANEYPNLLVTTPLRLNDLEDGGTTLFRNMFHIRHGVTLPYFLPIFVPFRT